MAEAHRGFSTSSAESYCTAIDGAGEATEEFKESCSSRVKHMIYAAIGIGFLAIYPWGLVTQMHNVKGSMVPCSERCLQFKVWDDSSAIPNTGPIPYKVANGRDINWGMEDLEKVWPHMVVDFTKLKLKKFPSLKCPGNSTHDMIQRCATLDALENVYNPAPKSVAYFMFVSLLGLWCCVSWVHDAALVLGCSEQFTLPLQLFSTLLMMSITSYAFHWAENSMQLFFSPLDANIPCGFGESCTSETKTQCGCLFRLDNIPMLLAQSVPFSLFYKTYKMTDWTMRAALGGDYLIGQSYKIAHRHVQASVTDSWSSLLGAHSVGERSEIGQARIARVESKYPKWLFTASAMIPVGFILVWMPASRAAVNLQYRVSDLLGRLLVKGFKKSVILVSVGEWLYRTTVLWAFGNFLYLGVFTLLPFVLIVPRLPLMIALWKLGRENDIFKKLLRRVVVVACTGVLIGFALWNAGGNKDLAMLAILKNNFMEVVGYAFAALLFAGLLLVIAVRQFWLHANRSVVRGKELKWIYELPQLRESFREGLIS